MPRVQRTDALQIKHSKERDRESYLSFGCSLAVVSKEDMNMDIDLFKPLSILPCELVSSDVFCNC